MVSYPSKVLLFGEYTVLFGGQALAVPYFRYAGKWETSDQDAPDEFLELINYLKATNSSLNRPLDLEALKIKLGNGSIFQSSIPVGMGLGSSAALSASLYSQFSNLQELSLQDKQSDLAVIESYYHGKSSGFDALVCLQQKPLLAQRHQAPQELNYLPDEGLKIYLLFTNKKRKTQNMVSWFERKCQNRSFRNQMEILSQKTKTAIDSYLKQKSDLQVIKEISKLQFEVLPELVIGPLKDLWEESLLSDQFALKLLGAGGGGCYLVFSNTAFKEEKLKGFRLEQVDPSFFRPITADL